MFYDSVVRISTHSLQSIQAVFYDKTEAKPNTGKTKTIRKTEATQQSHGKFKKRHSGRSRELSNAAAR